MPTTDRHGANGAGFFAEYFALPTAVSSLEQVDFNLNPTATDTVAQLDILGTVNAFWDGGSSDQFAARYTSTLNIESAGDYTFFLESDDGSAIYINGERVINNDGNHSAITQTATVALDAGAHDIEVRYYESYGDQTLRLEWQGADTDGVRTLVSGDNVSLDTTTDTSDDAPVIDQISNLISSVEGGNDLTTLILEYVKNLLETYQPNTNEQPTDHGGGHNPDQGGDMPTDMGGDETPTTPVDHGGDEMPTDGHGGGHMPTDGGDEAPTMPTGGDHDGGHGRHGGGMVDLPETTAEIEAFVRQVMSEPDGHMHGDNAGMAMEHGQVMDLVPRAEATHIAISNGDWFDPSTWYEGRIPDADAKVLIPRGITVNYDGESDASLFTVRIDGQLSFATDTDTKIVVDTMVVGMSGKLEIGTEDNPVNANVNTEIVIANNGDIDTSWDPSLLSRGVISHGEVEIHGAEKTSYVNVSDAPMAGDTALELAEAPTNWQVGDTIVISGTHKEGWSGTNRGTEYLASQDEEVTITAINGNQVSFDQPLEFDHDTPRADLFAYVANMSRNVTFSSEDGADSAVHHRGHVMFMHSDDVDVRYAGFDDLGRTDKSEDAFDVGTLGSVDADSNIKGRYAFHFHKTGTEDQEDPAIAIGNTVSGSPGWGFVHHSSHANFTDNVAFDVFGAAFAAEDGDETGIWLGNMAINSQGIGYGNWDVKDGPDVNRHDNGRTGDGFFFAGRLVEAAENVAINTTNGFVWMHRGAPQLSPVEGLDIQEIALGEQELDINLSPIQGFRNNEAFGTHTGLVVIKNNASQEQHEVRSVFDGFLNWETNEGANISYTAHYTLLDFDLVGSQTPTGNSVPFIGLTIGVNAYDIVANGLNIEGFDTGVQFSNVFHWDQSMSDVGNILIDANIQNVGELYDGWNSQANPLLSADDLVTGRLSFEMTGEKLLGHREVLRLDGTKTDSIGTRDRGFDNDQLEVDFAQLTRLITTQGYYTDEQGRNVLLVEDFIADRATGELMKFAHVVVMDKSRAEIDGDWLVGQYGGAVYNGRIDLSGDAPDARNDRASTAENINIFIDILANDTDADGDTLIIDGILDPSNGDVYVQDDGRVLYQPNHGFSGTDSFNYWASDENGNFSLATVTVEVWDV